MRQPWFSLDHTGVALQILSGRGCRPKGVLDVGAFEGAFARAAAQAFPKTPILMIEARSRMEDRLKTVAREYPGLVEYRIAMLGAESQDDVPFYQLGPGSSVYEEQTDIPREIVFLPMRTLDEIVAAMPADREFDFLKLDVQGAELDVLRGAEKTLAKVEVIFTELSVHEYNKGAPLIFDVISKLDAYGFVLFDMFPLVRSAQGVLLQTDGTFVRKGSKLRPQPPFF